MASAARWAWRVFQTAKRKRAAPTYPRFRAQRYFFRQTFGLGGEQEDVADAANQLPGKRDIDRVTLTSADLRSAISSTAIPTPRIRALDFMNWAMWSSAAYDFPADLPGFTRGAVVELNRKDWAVRAGLFQVPSRPTATSSPSRPAARSSNSRSATRSSISPASCGSASSATAAIPATTATRWRSAPRTRRSTSTTSSSASGATISNTASTSTPNSSSCKDVGLFARASWNDGQNEILSFTDIDRSLSGGLSIKGSYWGRPSDTIGIGGAINGLSNAHRDFLAAGGLGLLIGDGRLNYRPERILETYYAYAIDKDFTFTADYQFITNPAYNADRGPVSIFSGRLHGEF